MNTSTVEISMLDENDLGCSYAVVTKKEVQIIIILKEAECAVFDYNELKSGFPYRYLLFKHYPNCSLAYTDFLKLIGKMCKKDINSKYFRARIIEDNRMVRDGFDQEHMISEEELCIYEERFNRFCAYVAENRKAF